MKAWVFYHQGCTDGAAAAYAAWKKFGNDACYTSIAFGDSITALVGMELFINEHIDIYFLDVTPNPKDIGKLLEMGHKVTIVDHHKSWWDFIEQIDHGPSKTMMTRHATDTSGSMLAWDLFHGTPTYPDMILYVNDYDLYRFRFGDQSRQYQALFETTDLGNINAIAEFAERPLAGILEEGKTVVAVKQSQVQRIVKNVFQIDFNGVSAMVVFAPRDLRNEVADYILDTIEDEGIAIIIDQQDQNKFGISTRSRKSSPWDVDELCKPFGGGGHRNAAGFVTNDLTLFGIGEKVDKSFIGRLKALFKR